MEPSGERRRREDGFLRLARQSHAVALDPGQWPELLRGVADYFGCGAAIVLAVDRRSGQCLYAAQSGVPEAVWSDYLAHWLDKDQRLETLRVQAGAVYFADDATRPVAEPEHADDFPSWLDQHPEWHAFTAMRLHENSRRTLFTALLGGSTASRLSETWKRDFQAIASLIRSAALVSEQLRAERSISCALASSLNYLPTAVLVVAADGQVLYSNTAARHLMRRSRILHLHDGRLRLARDGDNQSLHSQIRNVIDAKGEERRRRLLQLNSADGQQSCTALTAPLPAGQDDAAPSTAVAMVMIWEPELSSICADSLREIFGLTVREAELASHIASGRTIAATAQRMEISRSTARVHLERVLAKTGTHRQTELVALIRTSPAAQPPLRRDRRGS